MGAAQGRMGGKARGGGPQLPSCCYCLVCLLIWRQLSTVGSRETFCCPITCLRRRPLPSALIRRGPRRLRRRPSLVQLEGLNWLYQGWKAGTSLILADDMGLGKTVQVWGGEACELFVCGVVVWKGHGGVLGLPLTRQAGAPNHALSAVPSFGAPRPCLSSCCPCKPRPTPSLPARRSPTWQLSATRRRARRRAAASARRPSRTSSSSRCPRCPTGSASLRASRHSSMWWP